MNTIRLLSITSLSVLVPSLASAQNLNERFQHVADSRAKAQVDNTSKARLLGALLYTDVTVKFNETPVRDAVNYLHTLLGVNIVGRYTDDRSATGIDPEAPITLDADNQPALTVLEFILDQCSDEECTWQLREGFVEVGTKDRLSAKSAREIRYYPIRDLLFEPPKFENAPSLDLEQALNQTGGQGGGGGGGGGGAGGGGGSGGGGGGGQGGGLFETPDDQGPGPTEAELAQNLIDIITETVESEAWTVNGGEFATIRYFQGVLIVNAPDYIQRQVGGYPFAPRVSRTASTGSRYVTFTGGLSDVQVKDIRVSPPIGGAAGGSTP